LAERVEKALKMESTLLFKTQSFMPSRFTKKYFEMLEKMPPKIRSEAYYGDILTSTVNQFGQETFQD